MLQVTGGPGASQPASRADILPVLLDKTLSLAVASIKYVQVILMLYNNERLTALGREDGADLSSAVRSAM